MDYYEGSVTSSAMKEYASVYSSEDEDETENETYYANYYAKFGSVSEDSEEQRDDDDDDSMDQSFASAMTPSVQSSFSRATNDTRHSSAFSKEESKFSKQSKSTFTSHHSSTQKNFTTQSYANQSVVTGRQSTRQSTRQPASSRVRLPPSYSQRLKTPDTIPSVATPSIVSVNTPSSEEDASEDEVDKNLGQEDGTRNWQMHRIWIPS